MWIKFDKDIFEKSDFKAINYIYQILSWYPEGSIPRYNILIDKEEVGATSGFNRLKNIENKFDEIIEAEFDKFVTENRSIQYHITTKSLENGFNIEESIRFFTRPVSIVLENNKNDSLLMRAIFTHFDSIGILIQHIDNGWIRFENAGGCSNVENFLEGELKSFEKLAFKFNKEAHAYFRGIVILDSDMSSLNAIQTTAHLNLLQFLNSKSISLHVLSKRSMENYIPDEVFQDLLGKNPSVLDKNSKTWITCYLTLSEIQKDYIKIIGVNSDSDLVKNGISISNAKILKNGSGIKNGKTTLPNEFILNSRVSKYSMSKRKGSAKPDEFDEIINKIYALL